VNTTFALEVVGRRRTEKKTLREKKSKVAGLKEKRSPFHKMNVSNAGVGLPGGNTKRGGSKGKETVWTNRRNAKLLTEGNQNRATRKKKGIFNNIQKWEEKHKKKRKNNKQGTDRPCEGKEKRGWESTVWTQQL